MILFDFFPSNQLKQEAPPADIQCITYSSLEVENSNTCFILRFAINWESCLKSTNTDWRPNWAQPSLNCLKGLNRFKQAKHCSAHKLFQPRGPDGPVQRLDFERRTKLRKTSNFSGCSTSQGSPTFDSASANELASLGVHEINCGPGPLPKPFGSPDFSTHFFWTSMVL